jgi:hypothetical protein
VHNENSFIAAEQLIGAAKKKLSIPEGEQRISGLPG